MKKKCLAIIRNVFLLRQMSYLTLGTKSLSIILQPTTRWQYRCFGFTLEELSIPHGNVATESNRRAFTTQHRLNIFCFLSAAWCWITKRTKTTVLCLQGGLPGRTVLICPSAPALQFSDVSLGGPMRKISPRREPASHLKDDSLHSLSSPRSPWALTRTHHRFSLISTHMHGKVCHRSPFSRFWYHTRTHTQELHFESRQWVGRRAGKEETQLEKCKLCHSDLWWWQVWERCGTTAGR